MLYLRSTDILTRLYNPCHLSAVSIIRCKEPSIVLSGLASDLGDTLDLSMILATFKQHRMFKQNEQTRSVLFSARQLCIRCSLKETSIKTDHYL
jgi:hypothetical protein